jgi:hypothetical protein
LRQAVAADCGHLRQRLAGGRVIDRKMRISGDKFAVEIKRICFHRESLFKNKALTAQTSSAA